MTRNGEAADAAAVTLTQALDAERRWLRGETAGALAQAPGRTAVDRKAVEDDPDADPLRSALCLSGGGVRSATFCMGVLQGLAAQGLLRDFHYLSTVSGGGYIGSWLSSWIMREGVDGVVDALARRTAEREPPPIRRLRAYANYLSPTWGLSTDFLSLAATFVRNLVLHWCVVLPLLGAAVLLPRLQLAMLGETAVPLPLVYATLALAVLALGVTIAYFAADLPGDPPLTKEPENRFVVCCFLPLLASATCFSWVLSWRPGLLSGTPVATIAGLAALHYMAMAVGMRWRRGRGLVPRPRKRDPHRLIDLLAVGASGALGGSILCGIATVAERLATKEGLQLMAVFAIPALLVNFWAGVTCYAGLASRITSEDDREWWARSGGWWLGGGAVWLLASTLVVHVPGWLLETWVLQTASGPPAVGVAATLVGIVTAAAGYWSRNGAVVKARAQTILQATRTRLLDAAAVLSILALALAMSYAMSCTLRATDAQLAREVRIRHQDRVAMYRLESSRDPTLDPTRIRELPRPPHYPRAVKAAAGYDTVLEAGKPRHVTLLGGALLAFAGFVSWVLGINAFSLHGLYANRLARTYLGASNGRRHAHWFTGFDPLDNPRLAAVVRTSAGGPWRRDRCLFPVINIALNLVQASGDRLEWQQRKAASFTMTPLHCGSAVLGFVPTAAYGGDHGGMSLGRAMAISGAAASPNMGYHSAKAVAFVMTLFNIRLGWWMPNPRKADPALWMRQEPRLGLEALYAEGITGATAERDFVHLSDGGHFENLGIYEMVRRRCRRIVAVDATCDPQGRFEDLQNAIRKIRVDFGIPIRFVQDLPTREVVARTKRCFAIGDIDYAAVEPGAAHGVLIYLKPALTGLESIDVASYAAAHRKPGSAFPHESTMDQFFDEAQFESYRRLGQEIVARDFAASGPWPGLPADPRAAASRVAQFPLPAAPAK